MSVIANKYHPVGCAGGQKAPKAPSFEDRLCGLSEYQAGTFTGGRQGVSEDRLCDLQDAQGEAIEQLCKCLCEVGAKLGVNIYRDVEPMNGDPLNLRERQRAQLETLRHAVDAAARIANAI